MSDTSGAGFMGPADTSSELNSTSFQTEQLMRRLRTLVPVRVVKVYKQDGKTTATRGEVAGAGFVDVQPVISQIDGEGKKTDHGTIYHVPYRRVYGGDFAIICDPVKGDIGHITCADRDTSAFDDTIRQGSTQNVLPGSRRTHDVADSVYLGGVLNNAPKQYVTVTDQGITIADKSRNTIVMTSGGITMTDANGNTIVMDGNGITLTPAVGFVKLGGSGANTLVTIGTAPTATKVKAL